MRRILFMSSLGAAGGALAAIIAYQFRGQDRRDLTGLEQTVKVSDLTLSTQLWSNVGLSLLGAFVCGAIAMAAVARKGPDRMFRALLIGAPLGAFMCWGARWLMDVFVRMAAGGRDTVSASEALSISLGPWIIWQGAVAVGLTLPVVLAVGVSKFTVLRGLIGAALVIVLGWGLSTAVIAVLAVFMVGSAIRGGSQNLDYSQIADVSYLFSMGLATGLAFAIAEAVYKPAWLKSRGGATEGRTWTLVGPLSRVGCAEGLEVWLPQDGATAPLHAQIQGQDESHFVADLVGATMVNGQPVQTAWLRDGDVLGIGSHQLVYRTRLEAAPQQAAPIHQVELPKAVARRLVGAMNDAYELAVGDTVVGRDASCGLALTWEPSVSRNHAVLRLEPNGGLTVTDSGSTNGTSVNGQRIQGTTTVEPGSQIEFGNAKFRFE